MPHDSMIIDALDALSQQLLVVDGDGRIVKANAAWKRAHDRHGAFGTADEGRDFLGLYRTERGLAPDVVARMRDGLNAVLARRHRNFRIEYAHRPAGAARPRWYVLTAWPVPNGHRGMIVSQQDVTEQRDLEAELAQQAHHDPLTALPNRRLFLAEARRTLAAASRRRAPATLLYLDLDGFKDVNDSLGHEAGDAVLRRVAARLEAVTREGDLLARLGGDEFVALLDGAASADRDARAERYRHEVEAPMVIHGHPVVLGASIGVAEAPSDAATIDELLRIADAAMYREKDRRRARFRAAVPTGGVATLGRA